jgi:hypothetical protein
MLSTLATVTLTTALAGAAHAVIVSTCSPEYRLGKSSEDTVWPGCLQLSYDFHDMVFTRDYCIVSDAPSWVTDDYRISTGAGAQWVCPSAKPDVRLTIETVIDIHGTNLRAELTPEQGNPYEPWHDSSDYLFVSPTHVVFKRKDGGVRQIPDPPDYPNFLIAHTPFRRLLLGGSDVVVHRWMIATYEWGSGCDATTITETLFLDPVSL